MIVRAETRKQLLRYAFVGIASNALLYTIYLALTAAGMGPKSTMTLVYCAGVAATFVFNRHWTFAHDGSVPGAMLRYASTYLAVYLLNLGALRALVDMLGLPHRLVMLALIFINAGLIFLLQKHWVFAPPRAASA